jgi:perosamine synthetase
MITTNNEDWAQQMRIFRNHGINSDFRQRQQAGTWEYDMVGEGFNYRLSDLQCALGLNQLKKLPEWIKHRQKIAALYDEGLVSVAGLTRLHKSHSATHGYHLYTVRVQDGRRGEVFTKLREQKIGVNVLYRPVYQHSFYVNRFGDRRGLCPQAETTYAEILCLPVFPGMASEDAQRVVRTLTQILANT